MAKPVLLTVDDDREVLRADRARSATPICQRLSRAAGRIRVGSVGDCSGIEGQDTVLLHSSLLIRECPAYPVSSFWSRPSRIYPDAKRVLLTAYADTDAAIAAINDAGINHYLLKPWDPPEVESLSGTGRAARGLAGSVSASV